MQCENVFTYSGHIRTLKELTMKTNLTGVTNVAKVFTCPITLKSLKGT
jgi:hypothetical protein